MTQKPLLRLALAVGLLAATFGLRPTPLQAQSGKTDPAAAPRETAPTEPASPFPDRPIQQLMIKFKDGAAPATDRLAAGHLSALSATAGVALTYVRPMSGDAHVLGLPQALPLKEATAIAHKLAARSEVVYAEPDRWMFPLATPNDTRYGEQWHYSAPVPGSYGANLPAAWDVTTGSVTITVAVIDTGLVFDHPDLAGRSVAGYDFISSTAVSNDGDGRDANAADPGDFVAAGECGIGEPADNSSWHGTHVAGTIGAATNNGAGVAGINWKSMIQPIRVLGKCGGFTSDIVDGIRWSAGLAVSGVPANATPARVINMSLGGGGACDASSQAAINDAVNAGTVVVVAAGNSAADASNFNPASCANVITVAASNRDGNRASYSNFGTVVEIAAPGGSGGTGSANAVLSTLNSGATTPVAANAFYQFYNGTSMAAPHVAGIASLVLSVNPSLTPAQVLSTLQGTVTPFPGGSTCTTTTCGSGIVNAAGAVNLAAALPSLSKRAFLPLAVRNSVTGCSGTGAGVVGNPGFESGRTAWTESSTNSNVLILQSFAPTSVTPHAGSWAVWLGGSVNETSSIEQSVTVGCTDYYLYFWNWIASSDFQGFDVGTVRVNGTIVSTVDTYSGANTNGWAKRVIDLNAYRGQTVTLRIQHVTDSSINTNWFIDDVGFQATP